MCDWRPATSQELGLPWKRHEEQNPHSLLLCEAWSLGHETDINHTDMHNLYMSF